MYSSSNPFSGSIASTKSRAITSANGVAPIASVVQFSGTSGCGGYVSCSLWTVSSRQLWIYTSTSLSLSIRNPLTCRRDRDSAHRQGVATPSSLPRPHGPESVLSEPSEGIYSPSNPPTRPRDPHASRSHCRTRLHAVCFAASGARPS